MPAPHRSRALPETSAPRVAAWAALAIGGFTALLLIGELTILE